MAAAGEGTLPGMLGQCRALTHLNLGYNWIRKGRVECLAGVLGQCTVLASLNLRCNGIRNGTERLAGVLGQCPALAHVDLSQNYIDDTGKGSLRTSWRGQGSGLVLEDEEDVILHVSLRR